MERDFELIARDKEGKERCLRIKAPLILSVLKLNTYANVGY